MSLIIVINCETSYRREWIFSLDNSTLLSWSIRANSSKAERKVCDATCAFDKKLRCMRGSSHFIVQNKKLSRDIKIDVETISKFLLVSFFAVNFRIKTKLKNIHRQTPQKLLFHPISFLITSTNFIWWNVSFWMCSECRNREKKFDFTEESGAMNVPCSFTITC